MTTTERSRHGAKSGASPRPSWSDVVLVVAPSLLAVLLSARSGPAALGAVAGAAVLWIGVLRGARTFVKLGTVLLLLGLAIAAIGGAAAATTVLAGLAVVVAWDAADHAISLAAQVGQDGVSWRARLVHVGATTAVGGLFAATLLGVRGLVGTASATAVALALLAVLLLAIAGRGD